MRSGAWGFHVDDEGAADLQLDSHYVVQEFSETHLVGITRG